MANECSQEKLSLEPILQDFSVSSLTDINPDILPPSDSSLMVAVADYEVIANISLSHTMSTASFPADSTIMENIQKKAKGPLFKKPFNYKPIKKPRPSLFDLDMKDSEPDTPEQKVCRAFKRKRKGNMLENESFSSILNSTDENMRVFNCSQNFSNPRKNKEKNLCNRDTNSESDCSFSIGPAFQSKKTKRVKRTSSVFHGVLEQSSDSPLSNISNSYKTSEENNSSKKFQNKQSLDIFPRNTNFITRRKARQNKLANRKYDCAFGNDLFTSDSESFSSKSDLEKHANVQEVKNSTFDDAVEHSFTYNLSTAKSPMHKGLPFKTSTRTLASKDLPGFDSPLNESRRKGRQKKAMNSKSFGKDICTSESDDSFSSKPALKRHAVVQEVENSTFDNALEVSIDSRIKSPSQKQLPFKTSMRTRAKDLPEFDSPLTKSFNESEKSIHNDLSPKKLNKRQEDDSTNFDDVINSTFDGSSLMVKDKTCAFEDKSPSDRKNNASINSSQPKLTNQTRLDISNKTEELNISGSMQLSNSEVKNKKGSALPFVNCTQEFVCKSVDRESQEDIEENIVSSPLEFTIEFPVDKTTKDENSTTLIDLEDQEKHAKLSFCDKNHRLESENTPEKLNMVEAVKKVFNSNVETNASQISSAENNTTNLTLPGQDNQDVPLTDSELNHSRKTTNLVKKPTEDSSVVGYNVGDLSIPDLNCESSNSESVYVENRVTLDVSETEIDYENNSVEAELCLRKFKDDSILKVHGFNTSCGKNFNSDSRYCLSNTENEKLSKSFEEINKSPRSHFKIKKQSVKRVSFKLRTEDERKSDGDLALNNSNPEEKSFYKSNQSQILNNSCLLESLVFDGSPSEITSGSVFLDLCASRNKSSPESMNRECSNDYQAENVNEKNTLLQEENYSTRKLNSTEFRGSEKSDEVIDKDSSVDFDDEGEPGAGENEKKRGGKEQLHDKKGEVRENSQVEEDKVRNKEHDVQYQNLLKSTKDRSVHFDESSILTGSLQNSHNETDDFVENSLLFSRNQVFTNPISFPMNSHNYQTKKPGSWTVLNEKMSTPLSKREVQEMLAKMPLSEFKRRKSNQVSIALSKEQMEQDKIEEMIRKRQKQRTVQVTKTPKLTKPNYMSSKVYEFIIEKLTPSFGLKSRIQAEKVVILLNEQVDVIMKEDDKLVQTVQEMKIRLANLKIIRTHWDFYKFIMNYFDNYFTQKVYPSGVTSPFEPDDPFQNVCD